MRKLNCAACHHDKAFHDPSCSHGICLPRGTQVSACDAFVPPPPTVEEWLNTVSENVLRLEARVDREHEAAVAAHWRLTGKQDELDRRLTLLEEMHSERMAKVEKWLSEMSSSALNVKMRVAALEAWRDVAFPAHPKLTVVRLHKRVYDDGALDWAVCRASSCPKDHIVARLEEQ